METKFNVGDRIKYYDQEATIIGFSHKNNHDHFQIEYDKSGTGHCGSRQLFDYNGNVIKCGESIKQNRWNVASNDSNIKPLEPVIINSFTKIIDNDSSELVNKGIARI